MEKAPKGTVNDHLERNPGAYNIPLKQFFKRDTFNKNIRHWFISKSRNNESNSFPWPKEIAICMPSVVTTFTRHPGPSRIFATDDDNTKVRLKYYTEESISYYDQLKQSTISNLIELIIKVRWTSTGELLHTVDTKTTLINAIRRDDIQFFKSQFKNINDECELVKLNTDIKEQNSKFNFDKNQFDRPLFLTSEHFL
jgi:hypothetical protein